MTQTPVLNKSVKRAKLKVENRKGDLSNGHIKRRDKKFQQTLLVHLWSPEVTLNLNAGQDYSHGSSPSKDVYQSPLTLHQPTIAWVSVSSSKVV